MYDAVTNVTLSNAYFTYDSQSRVSAMQFSFDYTCSGSTVSDQTKYSYAYSESTGNLSSLTVTFGGSATTNATISPQYDNLGRMTEKAVNFKVNGSNVFYNLFEYDYKSGPGESILVSQLVSKVGPSSTGTLTTTTYNYTYDANGNITQIKDANGVVQNMYTYDDLGQLIREDNRALNKSYVWTYDNAGNILSKKTYAFTTGVLGTATSTINYTYGNTNWGDLLTKYGNTTITYDTIGNPITIGGDTYDWEGRHLISRYDDYEYVTYTYNADGLRISKEYGEFDYHQYRHEYTLNGTQIVKETVYYNEYGDSGFVEDYTLVYIYDETGSPIGMKYREPSYAGGVYDVFFFEKNLQGDIVSVYNSTGEKVLSYTYDAWGNFTQTYVGGTQAQIFTAQKNPFRYRGYYYDADTGLYYLQSRYYNPTWGRFINADNQLSIGDMIGMNLFAYCGNNPVNRVDPTGEAWWHWALGAAIVAACAVATVVTCGGFATAVSAVAAVGSGVAAATTASTIAAGAFIGSATVYGMAAFAAVSTSKSVEEFNDQGNWWTVAETAGGALIGGFSGYLMSKAQTLPDTTDTTYNLDGTKDGNYINKRGWTNDMINDAINNGKRGTSVNMANNSASCTVYCYPGTYNQYVVIENASRSVVQVSNFYDSGWIPDSRIIWDP